MFLICFAFAFYTSPIIFFLFSLFCQTQARNPKFHFRCLMAVETIIIDTAASIIAQQRPRRGS